MTGALHSVIEAAQPPGLAAVRDTHRVRKAALLEALRAEGGSTRHVKG